MAGFRCIVLCLIVTLFPLSLSAQVIINEILADPAADLAGDANGDGVRDANDDEFIELVNNSGSNVDISGWTLSDEVSVRHIFPAGTVIPANCAIVIFGGGAPNGTFGNALVQTASSSGFGLNNGGDTVILNDGTSDVASVTYGSEGGNDESLTRPTVTDTFFVAHSTAPGSDGALFSPGTQVDGSAFSGCAGELGTGSITIEKVSDPAGGTGFSFEGDLGAFTLDDGQSQTFEDLEAGIYSITESVPAGWVLSSVEVVGGDATNITNGIDVNLQADQEIVVTFNNTEDVQQATPVIINEIDSDTPGTDDMEFIELFDGGLGNTSLDGLVVVLFNGSDDASYNAFDLSGQATDADGYFVLGNSGVVNVDMSIADGSMQNGADAVALYFGAASDFPNDTPVTTTGLVDAIVYDTGDADDAGLLVLLNSGQPQVDEDGGGDGAGHSLQRLPNGSGGARNTDTYVALPPTPGTENAAPAAGADLAVTIQDDLDPAFVGENISYTVTVTNNGPGQAANVFVADTLTSGLTFVSAMPDQGSANESGGVIFASLGDIESGGAVNLVIVATADSAGTQALRAAASSDADDPVLDNNFAIEETEVQQPPSTTVIINEIDSDTPGSDSLEFVELFDGGSGNTSLDGLVVVFFNGGNDQSYAVFDLAGQNTDADGFFVLGNSSVAGVDLVFNDNTMQNGADAVALYFGTTADFPNGTALTTNGLIDAIVYGTGDADDPELLTLLNGGQPQVDENAAGDQANHSLQRIPNGSGGARNTSAYLALPPTPDAVNLPPVPEADLAITVQDSIDPVFVGSEIRYTLTITNNGPDPAQNVVVDNTFPDGSETVLNIGQLASGAQQEVTVFLASAENIGTATDVARVTSDTFDPDSSNNTAVELTEVVPLPSTSVIINEIDSDTPGSDDLEFIELFDGGTGNTSLDSLVVVFFNGGNDQSYAVFDLAGQNTDADGFFVLGNSSVAGVDLVFNDNAMQNGADAVALYFGTTADFPNGTALTTNGLVDAIVYGTGDADDPELLTLLNGGQPQVDENAAGDQANHSLQRIPNGSGGARNTSAYLALPPTPDAVNLPPVPEADLAITVQDSIDPVFVGSEIRYALTVINNGPDLAQNVVVANTFPDGSETVLNIGQLASGAQQEVTVFLASAENIGTATDVARVTSDTFDPDSSNNTAVELTEVVPLPSTTVIINEIDSDTPGSDSLEFVELFDGGSGNTSLDGLVLVLFNGGNDASYGAIDLDGQSTDANGFFVVGDDNVSGLDMPLPGAIQNGPDAVALYFGKASNFPNGTPVTTTGLVDAIVYDTGDDDDAGLLTLLNAAQPQVNENGAGDKDDHSLQRIPNGAGGARNTASYIAIPPTPGVENVVPAVGEISASLTEIDYGKVQVGREFDINLLVTNVGNGNLVVDSTNIVGTNAGEWLVTAGRAPFALEPGKEQKVRVCFSPKSFGAKVADLRIRSNDPDGDPLIVPLRGTGLAPLIRASVSQLDFQNVQLRDTRELSFDLSNEGNANLQVTRITIGGSDGLQFAVTDTTTPVTIAPGDSRSYAASLTPTKVGNLSGRIRFYSNDNSIEYLVIPMKGRGTLADDGEPEIAVSATNVDFGVTRTGSAMDRSLTISNVGLAALRITALELSGPDSAEWQFSPVPLPLEIEPGLEETLTLTFAPVSEGTKQALLKISSNDSDEALLVVQLNGQAIASGGASPFEGQIVINEIHYNPSTSQGDDNQFEFIELYNTQGTAIALAGFTFVQGINHTFGNVDSISANGFLVLAVDSTSYAGSHQWDSGALVNTGEDLVLLDANGSIVDSVAYESGGDWPIEANGRGASLELISPALDNALPASWQASFEFGGTPGDSNSTAGPEAPRIAVTPAAVDAGNIAVGDSAEVALQIQNLGSAPLEVSSFIISGTDSADWMVAGDIPVSLGNGEIASLQLTFTPPDTGLSMALLTITSNDSAAGAVKVELTGRGVTEQNSEFAGIVVINEIHYNPSTSQGSDDDFEFLELTNTSQSAVSLAGFSFSAGIRLAFADSVSLPAGGFLVIAKTAANYAGSIEWASGNLVNTGELIELTDANGGIVDSVPYGTGGGWPSAANGQGPSLELINTSAENSLAENWQASAVLGGTPGSVNSNGVSGAQIAITPAAPDFGVLNRNAGKAIEIEISNTGLDRLQVNAVTITGPAKDLYSVAGLELPLILDAGASAKAGVQSQPSAFGKQDAAIVFESNAINSPSFTLAVTMYVNAPPEAPALVQPGWGDVGNTLVWTVSADPDPDQTCSFHLEIAANETFQTTVAAVEALEDTSAQLADIAREHDLTAGEYYYWRVRAIDNYDAASAFSETGYFQMPGASTYVDDRGAAPTTFALKPNYPNPFNPETRLAFDVPVATRLSIAIYNTRGQLIRALVDNAMESGTHDVVWDGRNDAGAQVASGLYLAVLRAEPANGETKAFVQIRKMTLLR